MSHECHINRTRFGSWRWQCVTCILSDSFIGWKRTIESAMLHQRCASKSPDLFAGPLRKKVTV